MASVKKIKEKDPVILITDSLPSAYSRKRELKRAVKVFDRTKDSVNHFHTVYKSLGSKQGSPTHVRQDLLRAMIVFTSSGLDALLKQVISDGLSEVIERNSSAHELFVKFIERRLKKTDSEIVVADLRFLSEMLGAVDQRHRLIKEYEYDLTSGSLQSKEEIYRVLNAFAVPNHEVIQKSEEKTVEEFFSTRNEIIHEMDIEFSDSTKSNTRKRRSDDVSRRCVSMFKLMKLFLDNVLKAIY